MRLHSRDYVATITYSLNVYLYNNTGFSVSEIKQNDSSNGIKRNT